MHSSYDEHIFVKTYFDAIASRVNTLKLKMDTNLYQSLFLDNKFFIIKLFLFMQVVWDNLDVVLLKS